MINEETLNKSFCEPLPGSTARLFTMLRYVFQPERTQKGVKKALLHVCSDLINHSRVFQLQLYSHQPIHNHRSRDKQED